MPKKYPIQGESYTYAQILELVLRDSPFLMVPTPADPITGRPKGLTTIQDACVDDPDEFAAILGDRRFKYLFTTSELIPIFEFVGTYDDIKDVLDFEPWLDTSDIRGSSPWWCTPKAYPNKQYYQWADSDFTLLKSESYDKTYPPGEGVQSFYLAWKKTQAS